MQRYQHCGSLRQGRTQKGNEVKGPQQRELGRLIKEMEDGPAPNSYRQSKLQLKEYKQQNLMIGTYVLKDASNFK